MGMLIFKTDKNTGMLREMLWTIVGGLFLVCACSTPIPLVG